VAVSSGDTNILRQQQDEEWSVRTAHNNMSIAIPTGGREADVVTLMLLPNFMPELTQTLIMLAQKNALMVQLFFGSSVDEASPFCIS
jgi:hypothetical protein